MLTNKFNDVISNIITEDVHSDAARKARVDYEIYHVVHNKKSGTVYPMRKSHYDAQKATAHLEIQGTYHPHENFEQHTYERKTSKGVTILPRHINLAAKIKAMNAGKIKGSLGSL